MVVFRIPTAVQNRFGGGKAVAGRLRSRSAGPQDLLQHTAIHFQRVLAHGAPFLHRAVGGLASRRNQGVKLAVSVIGPFMITNEGFAGPL
jgi:hypothetical protein